MPDALPIAAPAASPPVAAAPPAAVASSPAAATPPAVAPASSPDAPLAASPVTPLIGEPPADPAAPASIEYKDFTLPEGVPLDPELMGKFKPLAAEMGLTQEAAQKLVDLQAGAIKLHNDNANKGWEMTQRKWQGEVMADPVLGGDNFPATKAAIESGLKTMFGADTAGHAKFLAALQFTGASNHPDIIRGLRLATLPRSEGGPVTGNAPTTRAKSAAEILYPSSKASTG